MKARPMESPGSASGIREKRLSACRSSRFAVLFSTSQAFMKTKTVPQSAVSKAVTRLLKRS